VRDISRCPFESSNWGVVTVVWGSNFFSPTWTYTPEFPVAYTARTIFKQITTFVRERVILHRKKPSHVHHKLKICAQKLHAVIPTLQIGRTPGIPGSPLDIATWLGRLQARQYIALKPVTASDTRISHCTWKKRVPPSLDTSREPFAASLNN
jgi:hypothetical protein